MNLSFEPLFMRSGCCNKAIKGYIYHYWCSFCGADMTNDLRCVQMAFVTGDPMYLWVGHATPVESPIIEPVVEVMPEPKHKKKPLISTIQKRCNTCREDKYLHEFYGGNGLFGRRSTCRYCSKIQKEKRKNG